MSVPSREDLAPTPAQLAMLATYVRVGSWRAAAEAHGVCLSTAKNHSRDLYARLGVRSAMQAAVALGWVRTPDDPSTRGRVVTTDIEAHANHRA
jgi:hypothetical protein